MQTNPNYQLGFDTTKRVYLWVPVLKAVPMAVSYTLSFGMKVGTQSKCPFLVTDSNILSSAAKQASKNGMQAFEGRSIQKEYGQWVGD